MNKVMCLSSRFCICISVRLILKEWWPDHSVSSGGLCGWLRSLKTMPLMNGGLKGKYLVWRKEGWLRQDIAVLLYSKGSYKAKYLPCYFSRRVRGEMWCTRFQLKSELIIYLRNFWGRWESQTMCGFWDLHSPTRDYTWALGHDNAKS